jgi:1A family penicillin-binding protein
MTSSHDRPTRRLEGEGPARRAEGSRPTRRFEGEEPTRRLDRAGTGSRRSPQPEPWPAYASRREPTRRSGTYVPPPPPPPLPRGGGRRGAGCGSTLLVAALSVGALLALFLCVVVAGYAAIASDLPSPEALRGRSASFVSTRIYDRNGHLLHEIMDPTGGRRILVPYEQISPYLVNATVATEDERFWQHPGVDPIGIARAILQNVEEGGVVSGASTIPQQLVRLVLLSPEERTQQTMQRKIREAVLASEVTRRYSKREILEIYLNEINYGNLAYGIEAASDTYFGKVAGDLTLAEASFLAGLPQAPAYWDPYSNFEGAKRRQAVVLRLMVEQGYISPAEADAAAAEEIVLRPRQFQVQAPHFVVWVQQLLEQKYGADVLYRSGLRVTTTLDTGLQDLAQEAVRAHLATLADRHATNAALVALQPATGEILAMLGSADFDDAEIDGQVNVSLRPRQPGSSIKPVNYVTAFEKGWTPATLVWDMKVEYTDAQGRPWSPRNYDGEERGPVLVREALARSLNIPAVKTLEFVGIPAMLDTAHRLGIASLDRTDYGLSLTLGGGDVTLLEMAGAYAAFANGGKRVPPVAILRIEDSAGGIIEEYQAPPGEQVISAQHAYLITDILADNRARAPSFGQNNPLVLSRPAAAKTGTTDDWRDAWTVGYTPELVAGVWVGNADNTPMNNVSGARGAAPIWQAFVEQALAGRPVTQFSRPEGIEEFEISADSGALPSEATPPDRLRREIFAAGQGPLGPEHDFHQFVSIDVTTGGLATEFCPPEAVEERYYYLLPGEEGRRWAEARGIPQPPADPCPVHGGPAQVAIFQPLPWETVSGEVYVVGRANMPGFAYYVVEYGEGDDPIGWGPVAGPVATAVESGLLAVWDVRALANGPHTLRVVVFDGTGHSVEARTWVNVENVLPTATEAPTWTPEPSATPAPSATPTETSAPTATATSTPAPTDTPTPTATSTPTPTETPAPTETPTPTPTATTEGEP